MTTARILGAILSGGKALRMSGINKGLLVTRHGQSTLQHLIHQMHLAGLRDVVILANDPLPYLDLNKTVIPDLHPGAGPLAGLEAALLHARQIGFDGICTLPCDVPGITFREIQRLMTAFNSNIHAVYAATAKHHGHFACSIIPTTALPTVTASLLSDERSLERCLRRVQAQPVLFENESTFLNLNSPSDIQEWKQRSSSPPSRRDYRATKRR